MSNTTFVVDEISAINFSGNIIPSLWYKKITFKNKKADLISINILADIVYWYRATEIREEGSGTIIDTKKKFRADKLQRSYTQISDQFGITKRQAGDAIHRLERQGLVTIEFRSKEVDGLKLTNVLYIEPVPEAIKRVTFAEPNEGGVTSQRDTLSHPNVTPPSSKRDTYTETSTETSLTNIFPEKPSTQKQFEEFWNLYDLKLDKQDCLKVFTKLVTHSPPLFETIMNAVQQQNLERQRKKALGLFAADQKYPLRWLKKQCWTDETKTEEQINEEHNRNRPRSNSRHQAVQRGSDKLDYLCREAYAAEVRMRSESDEERYIVAVQ